MLVRPPQEEAADRERRATTIGPTALSSPKSLIAAYTMPPVAAAAGRVRIQPITIRPATAQLTAAPGRPTPEPVTAPETTCVVERG
jgi:hypothetical protein